MTETETAAGINMTTELEATAIIAPPTTTRATTTTILQYRANNLRF